MTNRVTISIWTGVPQPFIGGVEPQDGGKRLWSDAEILAEPSLEVTPRPTELPRNILDADATLGVPDASDGVFVSAVTAFPPA